MGALRYRKEQGSSEGLNVVNVIELTLKGNSTVYRQKQRQQGCVCVHLVQVSAEERLAFTAM